MITSIEMDEKGKSLNDNDSPDMPFPVPDAESQNQVVFLKFPLHGSVLFAAACPLIGAVLCVAISITAHKDVALNDTWACNGGQSLPTISTSIGIFTPQKYLWTLLIMLHFPVRIFFGFTYKIIYLNMKDSLGRRSGYNTSVSVMNYLYIAGVCGLILLTAVDSHYFAIHALGFLVWLSSSCSYMTLNTALHHLSGWRRTSQRAANMFWIKSSISLTQFCLTASVLLSYPHYVKHCEVWMHTLFSTSEYLLVFFDILFNVLPYFDLPPLKLCLSIDFSTLYDGYSLSTIS